jgi:hypothetical protein
MHPVKTAMIYWLKMFSKLLIFFVDFVTIATILGVGVLGK